MEFNFHLPERRYFHLLQLGGRTAPVLPPTLLVSNIYVLFGRTFQLLPDTLKSVTRDMGD